jgi:IS30 family transposase
VAVKRRWGFSGQEKADLWGRWKAGESLSDIARALDRQPGTVFAILAVDGGVVRPSRTRSRFALTPAEREEITRGLAAACSIRSIALRLGRAPSTVSREIIRNGGASRYRGTEADQQAWRRAKRPKPCRLALHARLRSVVAKQLRADWSPAQIAGWLMTKYPDDDRMRVSAETIYRSLYIQARGVLKKELIAHLRRHRPIRRSRLASSVGQPRGQIIDAVSIAHRPASIEDRAIPGHWEGDLIAGAKNSYVATLVERQSRFVQLVKVAGKDTASVTRALTKHVQQLPHGLMLSLTWDRGMEMAKHAAFTIATDVAVYFCDPQSPWQRGSNENTNGLLRQYFPKGTDLSVHTQSDFDAVALRLNTRPRKTLGFITPAEKLAASVASIG